MSSELKYVKFLSNINAIATSVNTWVVKMTNQSRIKISGIYFDVKGFLLSKTFPCFVAV